jgi:hypothetical protein
MSVRQNGYVYEKRYVKMCSARLVDPIPGNPIYAAFEGTAT